MANYYFGAGIQSNPMDAYRETAGMVKQSRLAKLLGGYYQNGQADLGQIAEIDPQTAQAIQKEQEQRGLAKLFGEAYAAPEDQRGGMLGQLIARGANPDTVMKLDPRYGKAGESFTLSPGSARYGPDGKLIVNQPFAPKGFDGTWDSERGMWIPKPGAMPSESQVPIDAPSPREMVAGGEMFAGLGQIPGVQVTSGLRTPEHNKRVGGVSNSYHLTDQARDIVPPRTPEQAQQVRQFAAQNGLEIIDEGDHWHLEPRSRGGQQAGGLSGIRVAGVGPKQPKPNFQSRRYTEQEVAEIGLPAGTVAYTSEDGTPKIVNKPNIAAGGQPQVIDNGDGTQTIIPAGKTTEDQNKSAGYALRMEKALKDIAASEKVDPSANRPGVGVAMLDMLPTTLGNYGKSAERQNVEAAQLDALDAALTLNTGAAYTKEQLYGLRKSYFPQPGDEKSTIKAKRARLEGLIQTARLRARGAYPSQGQAKPSAKPAGRGPTPGAVENGYRFKGGNPADPKSWERV